MSQRAATAAVTAVIDRQDWAEIVEAQLLPGWRLQEWNSELLLFTGSNRQGRPGMGSWVTYGLGSENENLPGFVVLISSGVQFGTAALHRIAGYVDNAGVHVQQPGLRNRHERKPHRVTSVSRSSRPTPATGRRFAALTGPVAPGPAMNFGSA